MNSIAHAHSPEDGGHPNESSAVGEYRTYRLSFHGDGMTLFGMFFVGALLSMITLGIYSFWLRSNVRAWFFNNTELDGDRFEYHGTGGELLVGTLKAMGLFIVGMAAFVFLAWAIHPAVAQLFFVAVIALATPVLTVGALRYRLSRTSWRGIRFSFRGKVSDYARVFLPNWLLTAVTLGFYGPWFYMRTREYRMRHMYFGNRSFDFNGAGLESAMLGRSILAFVLAPFTLGLSMIWHFAWLMRELWARTSFNGAAFRATITGGALLKHLLLNGLIFVCTLGIGFAWIRIRNQRFLYEHLFLEGAIDFASIVQEAQDAPATADELAELLDLGVLDLDLGL